MTAPTFTRRLAPELGPDVTEYRLECAHGVTFGHVIPGDYTLTGADVLALLVEKHEREERCGCARALARMRAPGARN